MRRRCDGVPLYIDEVVAKLVAQPIDSADSTQVPYFAVRGAGSHALRAGRNARRIVEAAAIIGSRIDRLRAGARTVGLSEDDVDSAVQGVDRRPRARSMVDAVTWRSVTSCCVRSRRRCRRRRCVVAFTGGWPMPSWCRRAVGTTDWRVVAGHCERAERYDEAAVGIPARVAGGPAARRHRGGPRLPDPRSSAQAEFLPIRERPATGAKSSFAFRRGFLFSAVEGTSSLNAAADFELVPCKYSESGG